MPPIRHHLLASVLVAVSSLSALDPQQANAPPNAAVYEVKFSFTGRLGALSDAQGCPGRDDGKAVMSGLVYGIETVQPDDDLVYIGVLRLDVDVDLCEATPPPRDELCTITVVGGGPMNVELTVYADDRGGYVKSSRAKGVFGARAEGSCGAPMNNEELQMFPDRSRANPFNGTELALPSGPLRVGKYENEDGAIEVVRVVRRPQ
jgi:hypothetical protein